MINGQLHSKKKKAFPNSTFTVRRGKMKTFFYLNNFVDYAQYALSPTRPPPQNMA